MRATATTTTRRRLCLVASTFTLVRALASSPTTSIKKGVTLVTFDVDGTLVQGSSAQAEVSQHARAFSYGVGSVFAPPGTSLDEFQTKYPAPLAAIDPKWYHGSTDGLIALQFAKQACGVPPQDAVLRLNEVYRRMFEYCVRVPDAVMMKGIEPLPGVVDQLQRLRDHPLFADHVLCGLVTGNVEGIARKKMRACGIVTLGVLARSALEQEQQQWPGEDTAAFLGGFGSDFCSGNLADESRIHKDRGEQIAIAYRRAQTLLRPDQRIVRVVHVGDAPGDVLAAKYCSDEGLFGDGVAVGCVAVATGKFSKDTLEGLFGEAKEGQWEPVCLLKGVADPSFIDVLRIRQ